MAEGGPENLGKSNDLSEPLNLNLTDADNELYEANLTVLKIVKKNEKKSEKEDDLEIKAILDDLNDVLPVLEGDVLDDVISELESVATALLVEENREEVGRAKDWVEDAVNLKGLLENAEDIALIESKRESLIPAQEWLRDNGEKKKEMENEKVDKPGVMKIVK